MENFKEYRHIKAEELLNKRGKDGVNTNEAYNDLEKIRQTAEYQESEAFNRASRSLSKLDGELEGGESTSFESIPINVLIEKYNISKVNEKFERSKIESLLSAAETREQKYKILEEQVSNTPLLEMKEILPNGNKLYIKLESETALGQNHYMRVYFDLIKHHEEQGNIKPGDELYDFTTGSSGVSMAAIGTLLGYKCHLGMPAGGEKAREKAILEWIPEDQLHFSDAEMYVDGAPRANLRFKAQHREVFFLEHSMVKNPDNNKEYIVNKIAIDACAKAVNEVVENIDVLDKFIAVSGNGTTQFGYGHKVKELYPNTEVIGIEPFQSAYVFNEKYPNKYKDKYGLEPEDRYKFSRHNLPGTTGLIKTWRAPAIDGSISILSDEILLWDKKAAKEYKELTGNEVPKNEVFYDQDIPAEFQEFGRTTRAGYKVALKLANETQNRNFLIFAYDHADRYDKK